LAAIGLALWTGFLVVGPPVGLSEPDRWEYVGWDVVSAFVSAGYTVFRLTKENRDLKARFKPKVRIVHFQGKKPDYLREAHMGNGVVERRHLVGVINDSGVKINDIRIVVERFEPYQQGATWAHAPLNPLRGTPNNSGWFNLTVADGVPTQYVEVFQELRGVPGTNDPILGCIYNSTGLNNLRRYMLGDWFAVVLRLEGDIPPCRFKLVAQRNVPTRWFDDRHRRP
jgi:hypothetical protein